MAVISEIKFSDANKKYFKTNEPVELIIVTKNISNFTANLYEINCENYYK